MIKKYKEQDMVFSGWLMTPLREKIGELEKATDKLQRDTGIDSLNNVCRMVRSVFSQYITIVVGYEGCKDNEDSMRIVGQSTREVWDALSATAELLPEKGIHKNAVYKKLEYFKGYVAEGFSLDANNVPDNWQGVN